MNYKDDIERLKRELSEKERQQKTLERDCNHKWGDTQYDPEEYMEPAFSHFEGHGSDPVPRYNYYPAKKDRWSRECKKCGKKEYTYEKAPTKYEPKF